MKSLLQLFDESAKKCTTETSDSGGVDGFAAPSPALKYDKKMSFGEEDPDDNEIMSEDDKEESTIDKSSKHYSASVSFRGKNRGYSLMVTDNAHKGTKFNSADVVDKILNFLESL